MPNRLKWTPEAKERLKARILTEMRSLLAEGVYPSLRRIETRVGECCRPIRQARKELIEAGEVDVDISDEAARRRNVEKRERVKARLLGILRRDAEVGCYPSVSRLSGVLHVAGSTVRSLRDELRDEGLYRLPPGRGCRPEGTGGPRPDPGGNIRPGRVRGLDGSSAADLKAIEDRRLEIQAEKIARGEPYAGQSRPVEVLRSHDYRLRENRR